MCDSHERQSRQPSQLFCDLPLFSSSPLLSPSALYDGAYRERNLVMRDDGVISVVADESVRQSLYDIGERLAAVVFAIALALSVVIAARDRIPTIGICIGST